MSGYFIGKILRQRRLEKGLTQEELAYGIFSDASAISRIENGKQFPTHRKLTALLQRLDLPSDRYYALVDKSELMLLESQSQIISCQMRYQFCEGIEKLSEYESHISSDDVLAQQFYLSSKAVFGKLENGENIQFPFEEKLHLLFTALQLTVSHFDINNLEHGLYSIDEIKIINQIALTYSDEGYRNISIEIYRQLLNYTINHFYESHQATPVVILIAYNYSRDLCLEHRMENVFDIANHGLQFCYKTGYSAYLGGLLFNLAYYFYQLGQNEKSQKYFYKSYYVYSALEDMKNAIVAQSAIKELFHKEIDC